MILVNDQSFLMAVQKGETHFHDHWTHAFKRLCWFEWPIIYMLRIPLDVPILDYEEYTPNSDPQISLRASPTYNNTANGLPR